MDELLFSHVRVMKFEITNLKTEKKAKCWSRIIVIQDFFIEMKYYTIQNIWKEIGKLNFAIIDVDLAFNIACVVDIKLFFMDDWFCYSLIVLINQCKRPGFYALVFYIFINNSRSKQNKINPTYDFVDIGE